MNDPKAQPLDANEQRSWLNDHKADLGTSGSWNKLGSRIGVNATSLSLFATGKYNGPEDRFVEAIFRYRQTLAAQASMKVEAPTIPHFYETETTKKLVHLLQWAQRGRVVTAAMGAGNSKTKTATHFAACNANVFMVTLSPEITSVRTLLHALLGAMGEIGSSHVTQVLGQRVRSLLKDRQNALFIVDEAQHADVKCMEQLRYLHDVTGVGIALFGNESVQQRLEGGNRSAAFAQLFSRQSLKLVRSSPLAADIDAMLDAWEVTDEPVRQYMHTVGRMPGALRGATFTLELGTMLAVADRTALQLKHVQDAWAQLSARAAA